MITQHTSRRFVVFMRSVRRFFSPVFILYFPIAWFFFRRPDEISNWLRLQWYLLFAMWSVFLLSNTFGHTVRTVLMSAGLALLAVASFASFSTRWLWLAGCVLIAGVLFVEALPQLRKMSASFREKYRKISKASEI